MPRPPPSPDACGAPPPNSALSRRALFCGAGLLAASAVAPSARAASKVAQRQAGYKPHVSGAARCEKCAQFLPPASCKVVDGTIDPAGFCNFFAPRPP